MTQQREERAKQLQLTKMRKAAEKVVKATAKRKRVEDMEKKVLTVMDWLRRASWFTSLGLLGEVVVENGTARQCIGSS